MGIEEREEVKAKDIENIFNKIRNRNFPKLKKKVVIQVQKFLENQKDNTIKEFLHVIV
jgi:hypothetical protein